MGLLVPKVVRVKVLLPRQQQEKAARELQGSEAVCVHTSFAKVQVLSAPAHVSRYVECCCCARKLFERD